MEGLHAYNPWEGDGADGDLDMPLCHLLMISSLSARKELGLFLFFYFVPHISFSSDFLENEATLSPLLK